MNTSKLTDHELVTRVRAGHPDLFGPLVERHIRAAHAVAYARLGNTADAEDAVQEAFLRAYEALANLRDPKKFAAWLLTIARHEAARVAAKRHRASPHRPTGDDSPLHEVLAQSDSSFPAGSFVASAQYTSATHPDPAQHEMNAILRDHVMRLPEPAREVLLLHYFAGHSARDIATLLDLRRPAVLKRLQRAREQLAETMLRDLEALQPTEASVARQVARIAALTSALSIPAFAATGTAASLAALIGAKTLAGIAAALALAAGATLLFRGFTTPAKGFAEPTIQRNEAGQTATARESTPEPGNSVPPAPAPASVAPPLATDSPPPQDLITPATSEPESPSLENLSGIWAATITARGGPALPDSQQSNPAANLLLLAPVELALTQTGTSIDIRNAERTGKSLGEGAIAGNQLQLHFSLPILTPIGVPVVSAKGEFYRGAGSIELRGTYLTGDHANTVESENGLQTNFPALIPVQVTLARVPAEELSMRDFIALAKRDLEALYEAIGQYRIDHAGAYPPQLDALVPAYLDSLDRYSEPSGVQLQYNPPIRPLPDLNSFPYKLSEILHDDSPYHPELPLPERLAAFEQDLEGFWGQDFLMAPFVVLRYDKYELRLYLTVDGAIDYDNVAGRGTDTLPASPQIARAQQRASCANHLKQLGLTIMMFMNETPGEYGPPGWMTAYPKFLPDRRMLTCPSAKPGSLSYRMVWPTANKAEFKQLYRDRADDDAPDFYAAARVPLVFETHECSGSGGQNILFLDGHVEFIKGRLEDNPTIAPFLNIQ